MQAHARLVVELGNDGRSVIRHLRSQPPLALVARRGVVGSLDPAATVYVVGSASTPLAGDSVALDIRVGPGATLVLTGVAGAVALPGTGRSSSFTIRADVAAGASLQYLPGPTVVTARAEHRTLLEVSMHPDARLRCREVLVAGRSGEPSGRYSGTTRIVERAGTTARVLLHQTQELGEAALMASPAHLAGGRVLATEVLLCGADRPGGASGEGWALSPLPGRGSLAMAVGRDAVTVCRALAKAVAASWPTEPADAQANLRL